MWIGQRWYFALFIIEPRRGFAIINAEDSNKFIVRDGIVIDENFMENSPDEREPIKKHNAGLSLVLHLLPIPKNGAKVPISLEDAKKAAEEPDFASSVSLLNYWNSMQQIQCI